SRAVARVRRRCPRAAAARRPCRRCSAGATASGGRTAASGATVSARGFRGGGGGAKPGAPSAGVGSIDDLPVFGGVGFSEPAVLVPTGRASNNNKILYVMIGAVGLLAVAAVIMVVMLLKSK